jgi:hypothetical protein
VTNNPKKMAAHESEVSLRIRTRKELGESYGNSGLAIESRSNPRDDRRFLLGDRRRVEQWLCLSLSAEAQGRKTSEVDQWAGTRRAKMGFRHACTAPRHHD